MTAWSYDILDLSNEPKVSCAGVLWVKASISPRKYVTKFQFCQFPSLIAFLSGKSWQFLAECFTTSSSDLIKKVDKSAKIMQVYSHEEIYCLSQFCSLGVEFFRAGKEA